MTGEPTFDPTTLFGTWGTYLSVENYGDGGIMIFIWDEECGRKPKLLARLTSGDTDKLLRFIASGNISNSPCYGLQTWADTEHYRESGELPRASDFPNQSSAIDFREI